MLAIDVGEILRQVGAIVEQVARAVEFVFLFTLAGGVLVLQAAIAATQDERLYDAAILRTLGAAARQLTAAQLAEFLVLGALGGPGRGGRGDGDRLRAGRSGVPHSVRLEPAGYGRSASSAARSAWPPPAGSARGARCASRRSPCCASSASGSATCGTNRPSQLSK